MKLVLTSAIVLLALVCETGSACAQAQTETARPGVDSDGVQRVSIVAGEYFFKPARIVVKVNVPVELSVRKEPGLTPHNLVINDRAAGLAIEQDLSQEVKKITFTPKSAGKYSFYCSNKLLFTKSHRERGMEGVLEVVE
jgi:plastocyanin domain-containing protein